VIGESVGRYDIRGVLGDGGMGTVYRAWDRDVGREVALKLLRADDDSGDMAKRLMREARAASRAQHPGIVVVHDAGEVRGQVYVAMELLAGETLRDRLRRGPLDVAEAIACTRQVADALDAAHAAGVIHRDLKPANVMLLPDGRLKLLDFGLARLIGETRLTRSGEILGTANYMSPEQVLGLEAGVPSDVWALGVLVYEMLTARACFARDSLGAIAQAVLYGEPDPLDRVRPDTPTPLVDLVARCLAKDARQRPATAGQVIEALDAATVAGPPRPRDRSRLPEELSSFIGREREIHEVRGLFASHRLVTLTGPGGCGKTRLALRIAREVEPEFEHGAGFVDLAPVSDPSRLPVVVADALGVAPQPGADMLQVLTAKLRERRVLVVLDNAEHLVDAVARLADALLRDCAGVVLLATSREPLRVPGERMYAVAPLPVDDAGDAAASDAVRLFVARAAESRPGFALTDANRGAVVEICTRVDGIPLAIELAAARVRTLEPAAIAARLHDRFRLLSSGSRTAMPRQQTLRAAIEWSDDLLAPEERALFHDLAVFAGGWGLEAAETVAGTIDSADVLDVLDRLVLKSLVVFDDVATGPARYRFLETIREFALEQLHADGRFEDVASRHRRWCRTFAAARAAALGGRGQADAIRDLEREHANLLAAIDRAHADPAGADDECALVAAAAPFWSTRGHVTIGRERTASALAREGGGDGGDRLDVLLGDAQLAVTAADYAHGERAYAAALEASRRAGVRSREARARNGLGGVAARRSDVARAAEHYTEALRVYREVGDAVGVASALNNLANLALDRGEHDHARELYEESLSVTQRIGDERQTAIALYNLGYLALATGDDAAGERLERALEHFRNLGHRQGVALVTMNLARLMLRRGATETGEAMLEECLRMADQLGDRLVRANTLMSLGDAARARGDAARARVTLLESLELFHAMGLRGDACETLERLARLRHEAGAHADALVLLELAERLRREAGYPRSPADDAWHAALVTALSSAVPAGAREQAGAEAAALDLGGVVERMHTGG